MEIYIEDWRPTLINEMLRVHWATRYKQKNKDRRTLEKHSKHIPQAKKKRRVELEIGLAGRQKECDPDAPWKNLLDGLVKCGLLIDDSAKWCEISPLTFTRGKKYTRIKLIDID